MSVEGPPPSRLFRWGLVALSVVLCALYGPTLARTPTFSDGPELVTAIWTLGVPHPTGYPLFVVAAHVFTRLLPLPIEPVLKVEIFNMCAGIGASLFTAAMTRQAIWLREELKHARERQKGVALPPKGPEPRDADIASLFAGFTLGFSHLLWQQVRIPEVYPLHVLLVSAAAYAWVRFEVTGKEKYVVWSAVPMGLGLSHHVTMVYMLPAGGIYLFTRQPSFYVRWLAWPFVKIGRWIKAKRSPASEAPFWAKFRTTGSWAMPIACIIGAAPLLLYYYLIWANEHTTGVTWNDVKDFDQLYYHATGKQYSGFLGAGGWSDWIARIARVPEIFDRQFMPAGTALFFVGLVAIYRRAWRLGVFFTGMILFNVGHGVYYAVGDYANYYLPAVVACSALLGVGLAWLIGFLRHRKPEARRFWILLLVGAIGLTAGLSIIGYGLLTRRLPDLFAVGRGLVWGIPITAVGLAGFVMAIVLRKKAPARPWPLVAALATLAGSLAVTFVSASLSRAVEIGSQIDIGGSYGEELATEIPPGSVLLTQGDGFIFTMWYEHHVLGRGMGIATLDAGTLHAAWYRKYLTSHYPESCDPRSPAHVANPEAYEKKCGDFALRMARGDKSAWVNLGQRAPRLPPVTGAPEEPKKVARGDDPQCAEREHREANKDACKCWEYEKRKRQYNDTCVESFEEGGIVPRAPVEIAMERIIRAHIDERPVFERNVATFWVRDKKTNPRGWSGPAYQRISGEYALLSRGRYAQIVYADDVTQVRGCSPELDPVKLRKTGGTKSHGDRDPPYAPYKPNPIPVLIHASYLTPLPEGSDDDAARLFFPGDAVYLRLHFFERNLFDATKEDKKGALLRHGIRACVFDPAGKRVGMGTTISGKDERIRLLETTRELDAGTYTVQACSVGQLPEEPKSGDAPPPPPDPTTPLFADDLPCQGVFLEYTFQLAPRGRQ